VIVLVRFGPSGNSESFYKEGHKSSANRGVNIGKELAEKIGQEAQKYNIFLSIHAPYYINMASPEEEKNGWGQKG